jgi:hypothetical protein
MDQLRFLFGLELQAVEQRVEVARCLGAALHGEARGLVEDDHVIVAMDHERADELLVLL